MPDAIQDGDVSSASLFMSLLENLQATGQSVLDDLEASRAETLFRFEQQLSAINAKRQRAARVLAPDIACRFVTSDLLDIDQTLTSGTVRIDAKAATCRELSASAQVSVKRASFNCATQFHLRLQRREPVARNSIQDTPRAASSRRHSAR